MWIDGIRCYRFGQTGVLQRLFKVAAVFAGEPGSADESRADAAELILAQFKELAKAVKEKDQKAAALIGKQARFSANMWDRQTG